MPFGRAADRPAPPEIPKLPGRYRPEAPPCHRGSRAPLGRVGLCAPCRLSCARADGPNLCADINFAPTRSQHLASAPGRQDCEFQRPRGHALPCTQSGHGGELAGNMDFRPGCWTIANKCELGDGGWGVCRTAVQDYPASSRIVQKTPAFTSIAVRHRFTLSGTIRPCSVCLRVCRMAFDGGQAQRGAHSEPAEAGH